jgi:anti-sigma factor ChrR (cupin superfamily)
MKLNADLGKPAVSLPQDANWTPSPMQGVERRLLDRDGDEVARATSVVRYAPKSRFPKHQHEAGEEFFVLQGVFSDENGDFPAGTYVRNPPGTSHAPKSDRGCDILVKLRQFDSDDLESVVIDTNTAVWRETVITGFFELPLHRHKSEQVWLVRLTPGASMPALERAGGEELFVIAGGLEEGANEFRIGAWIRNPPGISPKRRSEQGCVFYLKTGHL